MGIVSAYTDPTDIRGVLAQERCRISNIRNYRSKNKVTCRVNGCKTSVQFYAGFGRFNPMARVTFEESPDSYFGKFSEFSVDVVTREVTVSPTDQQAHTKIAKTINYIVDMVIV